MASTAHAHPNYIKIFIILSVLTAVEIGVTFLGLPRTLLVALLVALAVWKAALVAIHFMHLKSRRMTLIDRRDDTVYSVRFPQPHVAAGHLPAVITVSQLPTLNAALNSLSAVFLCAGYFSFAVKTAGAISAACWRRDLFGLFLISYLVYHFQVGSLGFKGQGWIRPRLFHDSYHPYHSRRGGGAAGADDFTRALASASTRTGASPAGPCRSGCMFRSPGW